MIPVNKPFLPPIEEYEILLKGVWDRNWLTNHGPLVNELELKLKDYLKIDNLLYLTNGTIALQLAIKALDLKGEIITTPFSYIATTSSLIWEGCKPIFVDIQPDTLNIDPYKIEYAITDRTRGILATHVYGNPCEIELIEKIADKYNLKLIFDAAHCFGTKYKGKSVYEFGHISTASFHATKIFHTVEGGAVVTKDNKLLKKLNSLRNFGHASSYDFTIPGINGKNSEFHAAMGLCNLKYFEKILAKRQQLVNHYDNLLKSLNLNQICLNSQAEWNYSYYPVLFETEEVLMRVSKALENNYIYTRRYFYPSLNKLRFIKKPQSVPNSERLSKNVLCLPLFHTLSIEEVDLIAKIIIQNI